MPYLYNSYNLEALFNSYLHSENVSEVTLRNYLSDLRYFLGWFTEYVKIRRSSSEADHDDKDMFYYLDTDAIIAFRRYLKDENKLPDKSINRRLSTVRKFCSFAILQGWLKENPAKRVANLNEDNVANRTLQDFLQSQAQSSPQLEEDIVEFLSIIN